MSSPHVLITGAAGCIGSWILKRLMQQEIACTAFDLARDTRRLEMIGEPGRLDQVRFIQGDILDQAQLLSAIDQTGATHIIHLVGLQVPVCRAEPIRGAMVNVIGTLNVFDAARQRKDTIRHVAYASSAGVHGPADDYDGKTVDESVKVTPRHHYGYYKLCNEGNGRVYFQDHGISSSGMRPHTVFGPGRDQGITGGPTMALKAAVIGLRYTIPFTGEAAIHYVRDTADAFIGVTLAEHEGAEVYNVRGHLTTSADFIKTTEQTCPQLAGLISCDGSPLPITSRLDDSKLYQAVPDLQLTSLPDAISQTVEIFTTCHQQGRLTTDELN